MGFSTFDNVDIKLEDLRQIANFELPGIHSHIKMSPKMRQNAQEVRSQSSDFKESAVLIVLYEKNGQIYFPIIQRNTYDGTHSGQMSFPGGKREEHDENLKDTAIRETWEEIGVRVNKDSIIKELSEIYIPPSKFMVSPFVCIHKETFSFSPSQMEVAEIIEFPIKALLDESIIQESKVYVKKYKMNLKVPAFVYRGKVVWGATAIILSELKDIILKIPLKD